MTQRIHMLARLAATAFVAATVLAAAPNYASAVPDARPLAPRRDDPVIVTLSPARDNTLYEDATGGTSNGKGAHLFAGNSNASVIRRAVIAFDIAGALPATAEVDSVRLILHMSRTSSGTQEIRLHRLTNAWGEGGSNADDNEGSGAAAQTGDATWIHTFHPDSLWAAPGGDFDPTVSAVAGVSGEGRYTWTSERMEDELESWLADPGSNHGWVLIGPERDGDGRKLARTSKRFDSIDNDDAAVRPMLVVEYRVDDSTVTPETSTPDTATPETETPATPGRTPGANQTLTATARTPGPGTPSPETVTPETETPETETPGTTTPGTPAPETETPGTSTPGTQTPETATPESPTPGTSTPWTQTPGTPAPGTPGPESPTPGSPTAESPTALPPVHWNIYLPVARRGP